MNRLAIDHAETGSLDQIQASPRHALEQAPPSAGLPALIGAEVLKLHRSALWFVVVLLPALALLTGTLDFANNSEASSRNWDSLWAGVTNFHGLVFFSMGIAVLAATMWRMEHRGNWFTLMTTNASARQIVIAKTVVLIGLVAAMQLVLITATWLIGGLFFGLGWAIPGRFWLTVLLSVVAGASVAAFQSLLSMLIRSFAAPVGIALFGVIIGAVLALGEFTTVATFVLQALVIESLSSGGGAILDAAGAVTPGALARLVIPSVLFTVVFTEISARILARRDIER